jgi:IclR family KDG regulon transcriptional repressor
MRTRTFNGAREVAGTVARTALVLRHLAVRRCPVGVSQLSREVELPKSTVYRILTALADSGATVQHGSRHLLSDEWADLLQPVAERRHRALHRLLTPYVVDLHVRTGLVGSLVVRRGAEAQVLQSVYGHDDLASLAALPHRFPAHCTAAGTLLLALDPEAMADLGGQPLPALTDRTVTDLATLRRRLSQIRAAGIAVSHGVRLAGTVGSRRPCCRGPACPRPR